MTPQPEILLESEKKRLDPHVCDPEFVACEVEVETTPSLWRPESGPLEHFEPSKTFTQQEVLELSDSSDGEKSPQSSDFSDYSVVLLSSESSSDSSSDSSDDSSDDTHSVNNDSDNVQSPMESVVQQPQPDYLMFYPPPYTVPREVKPVRRPKIPQLSDLSYDSDFLLLSDLSDDSSNDTHPAHNDSDNVMSPKKRLLQDSGSSDTDSSESSQEREPVQLTPPVSDPNKPIQRDQRESITIIDLCSDDEPLQKKSRSADKPKEGNVMVENMDPSTRSRSPSVKKPSEPESGISSEQQKANEESKNVEDSSNKNNDKSEKLSASDRSKLQNKVAPSEAPPKPVIESPVAPQSDDSSDDDDQLATLPCENAETEVIGTVVTPQTPRLSTTRRDDPEIEVIGTIDAPKSVRRVPLSYDKDPEIEFVGTVVTQKGESRALQPQWADPEIEVIETVTAPQTPPQHENVQKETTGLVATPQGKTPPSEPQHEKSQEKITDMAVTPYGQPQPPSQYQLDLIMEQELPSFGGFLDSLDGYYQMIRAQTDTEASVQQNNDMANDQDPMQSTSGPSTSDSQPSCSNSGQSTSYGHWQGH